MSTRAWRAARLKHMVQRVRNGVWGEDPHENGSDVACVRAADFDRQRLRVKADGLPFRYVDGNALAAHRLVPGDLILEKSGGGERQPVGAAVLFDLDIAAVCSNFCARLRPANDIDPRFLNYSLAAAYYLGISERSVKQTTGIQNLDTDEFLATRWSYPDAGEQRRIADFLDAETARIDRLQDSLHAVLALLTERDAATCDAAFAGSARRVQLRRIVTRWIDYRGATPTKTSTGVPLITARNLSGGRIDHERSPEYISADDYRDWMRRGLPRPGDVLLTTEAPLGEVAILQDAGVALAQRIILMRTGEQLPGQWIYWYFRSPLGKSELLKRATGSTALGIKADTLRSVPIPTFDNAQMRQRIEHIESRFRDTDRLRVPVRRQLDLLRERRQALITSAVTGQSDLSGYRR
ncbi:restriction endonuclease subunit S [Dactylosporangium sp. CA-092794]|uniref:restriction endonuclease subunit S n=1 Tax=Dactylosporangium sp. CA-092794 TaxID=3239929 RepID=UPI003D8E9C0C